LLKILDCWKKKKPPVVMGTKMTANHRRPFEKIRILSQYSIRLPPFLIVDQSP
jgi:hypothetical protein